MKVGTTLIRSDGNPYYSPSFPRGGLAAAFAVKVTHFSGLTGFTITVQHRDENEVLFTDADSFPNIDGIGPESLDEGDLKQIIRFKYVLTGPNVYDSVHFIMQAPSWRPYD